MGIVSYIRQIRDEVIAEGVAEGRARVAEARAKAFSEGRQSVMDELRAMPTHEALAYLERHGRDPDPYPESPSNGSG